MSTPEQRQKHAARMRAWREANREHNRKQDRERKKQQRADNTPYAQRVRERKRDEDIKAHRNELRRTDEDLKQKARVATKRYREKNPGKDKARAAVNAAVAAGRLERPASCSLCGQDPGTAADGRSLLRADHFKGYDREHWLTVRWICVRCDGALQRKHP